MHHNRKQKASPRHAIHRVQATVGYKYKTPNWHVARVHLAVRKSFTWCRGRDLCIDPYDETIPRALVYTSNEKRQSKHAEHAEQDKDGKEQDRCAHKKANEWGTDEQLVTIRAS